MDNLMKQIREKFTGAEQERADQTGSRDQKIPIQKTQSFKEKKKAPSWFQRQFLRKMSHDYDTRELEHATAVAAAAYAINQQDIPESPESSLPKSKSKLDGSKSPISQLGSASKRFSGEKKPEKPPSIRKTSFSEHLTTIEDRKPDTFETPSPVQPASLKPPPPPPPPPPPIGIQMQPAAQPRPLKSPPPPGKPPQTRRLISGGTKAEAWERAELERIKERYDKLQETINSWESKKKAKAKKKLDKDEQSQVERRRMKASQKFQTEIKYIDQIAGAARAEADQRRRKEELKAKEKTNIIRTTGRVPSSCPCF